MNGIEEKIAQCEEEILLAKAGLEECDTRAEVAYYTKEIELWTMELNALTNGEN